MLLLQWRIRRMSTLADNAVTLFQQGRNCAQAVLMAGAPAGGGMDQDLAFRTAAGFGGGMARLGHVCGAVTGAIMVLGLRHADPASPDPAARQAVYGKVQAFIWQFTARHGSINCRDLIGCDLSTPEGLQQAKDRNLHRTVCDGLVRDAADILADLASAPPEGR
jgi:C_GCAxxG_C_C family probable redox protein